MVSGSFAAAAAAVRPLDEAAARAAVERHAQLAKPGGALGRVEAIGVQLAAISGVCPPPAPAPAAVAVFAADHGVHRRGVSPWPQDVTARMVSTFLRGGAAINVFARQVGASVTVVDVGVATDLPESPALLARKIRRGTRDIVAEPAMTVDEAAGALDAGADVAALLVGGGARCLVTGDMGIANTTASAAAVAAFTGRAAAEVTGRGTGIDDATLAVKVAAVEAALVRTEPASADADPLEVLASVGGLEIAALAGFVVGGAAARVPVLVDGLVAVAGLLVAEALVPGVASYCIAGHRSVEPGATAGLERLGLEPVLDLEMRLGEGTGACLAVPVVEAAARVLSEMATLEEAGVPGKAPESTE